MGIKMNKVRCNGQELKIKEYDVNKKYGCTYEVEPGYFIQLFQFDINDGYEHDFQANKQITIGLGNHEKMHLKLQG